MVRRPMQVKSRLVDLWRYFWTTMNFAMCTLPSPKASSSILKKEHTTVDGSCARGGPQTGSDSLKIQTYCDASFAPGARRSRSGILVRFVDENANRASLLLWQSRRQILTALSAPEAEVVALSEALMPLVIIHGACRDIGLVVGITPEILFVKTDSQVTLTQLRNESVTTRSRPFANRFNYAHDMCHGTTLRPAAVRECLSPEEAKRLMVWLRFSLVQWWKHFCRTLVWHLSLISNYCCSFPLKPPFWWEACQ